tara:strand:+ start:39 stop:905 length:867 start_codon:yes stop_codon:yes gene_type:complete
MNKNYIEEYLKEAYESINSKSDLLTCSRVEDEWSTYTMSDAIDSLHTVTKFLQDKAVSTVALQLSKQPLVDAYQYVEPSYYTERANYRGAEDDTHRLLEDTEYNVIFMEAFNMFDEFSEWDMRSFIRQLPEFISDKYYADTFADLDITILAPVKTYGGIDSEQVDICWGNTEIMSEADWSTLSTFIDAKEIQIPEYSDLVWHEVDCAIPTMINIFSSIDDEVLDSEYINILDQVQQCIDNCKLRGIAVAMNVEDIILNGKGSIDKRLEKALDVAQDALYILDCEEETA